MRLVDADALLAEYDRQHEGEPGKARKLIENAPTIERPTRSQFKRMAAQLGYEEVVRCQNCARWQRHTQVNRDYGHCEKHDCTMKYDDFCSRPERKTDEKV